MSSQKIGKIEAICLMLVITINEIVLNVPNIMILLSGSSTWLNAIYISLIAIGFSFLLCKLLAPFPNKDLLDISSYVGGKYLKIFVGSLFLIFFLFLAAISVRYLTSSIKIIYFNSSPIVFLLLFLILPAVIVNKLGLKSISGVNLTFIFIVIASLLFLLASSAKHFSFERLFPILGNGFNKTFILGITNIFAFTELAFLYFLPLLLKDSSDTKFVAISSTIISAIFLVLSITALLLAFSIVIKNDEMLSIYILTRRIKFGHFLERVDAVFIFIWLVSLLSSLCLTFFYILRIFQKLTKVEDIKVLSSTLGIIILATALLIKDYSQIKFLGSVIYRYSFIGLVFGVGLIVLIIANIKHKKKIKELEWKLNIF